MQNSQQDNQKQKWKTTVVKNQVLPSGQELTSHLHILDSGKPGPTLYIQASLHGAELQGNRVIIELIDYFSKNKLSCGKLTLHPLCNPLGTNSKLGQYTFGRFHPVTGENYNRLFMNIVESSSFDLQAFCKEHLNSNWEVIKTQFKKTLKLHIKDLKKRYPSRKFFLSLQELSLSHDITLDLHTGGKAAYYLYSAEYALEFSKLFDCENCIIIPHEFAGAMDEACFMPWVYLKDEFENQGREIELDQFSFTVEIQSEEELSLSGSKKTFTSILNILSKHEMIVGHEVKTFKNHHVTLTNFKSILAPTGGLIEYLVMPNTPFKEGDVLAKIYNLAKLNPNNLQDSITEVLAPCDGHIINMATSSSILSETEIFQISKY